MAYDPKGYEERQARNEKSRRFATRDRQPWTAEDDDVLLEFWVKPGSKGRDEPEVARALGRTIESCRNRVHYLVGEDLGRTYVKVEETTTVTRTVTWVDDSWGDPSWYVS
jgi:hypothetical protein